MRRGRGRMRILRIWITNYPVYMFTKFVAKHLAKTNAPDDTLQTGKYKRKM
jgi:hypothetical protein